MVTLISRPEGYKLTEQELSGEVTTSSGDAMVTTTFAHGLTDGDYVYIQSNIQSYNGFKYVDSTAYNTFLIRNAENEGNIAYKQDATISYKISVLAHGWQCVHLPIVYELESDLFPVNGPEEAYTPRSVVSFVNNNGYVQLNLSTALLDPVELDWIEVLSGTGAGVYRIKTVLYDWSVIIDLAYNASYTFGPVVKYYNNYCINVNIYAGIPSGHPWETEQPIELAATLRLTPDENNRVKFSISEILRGYIETRNNLTLDTLPNNTDFWTSFYIGYFESYDQSDGEDIETFEDTETLDTFEGFAVNAQLPFKSGSFLSDYVDFDTYLAQWLTIQTNPIAIVGRFFDLSFINRLEGGSSQPGWTPDVFPSTASYNWVAILNGTWGASDAWVLTGSQIEFNVASGASAGALSDIIKPLGYVLEEGHTYQYSYEVQFDGGSGANSCQVQFNVYDVANTILYSDVTSITVISGSALKSDVVTFVCPVGGVNVGIVLHFPTGTSAIVTGQINYWLDETEAIPPTSGGEIIIQIFKNGIEDQTIAGGVGVIRVPLEFDSAGTYCIQAYTPGSDEVPGQNITEEICITVFEECDDTLIDGDGNIRLLEDGGFRLLE